MGIGDEIMATGMARGAAARGKRIAFGDGRRLIWGPHCETAFKNNPNIARTINAGGDVGRMALDSDLEWIPHYKGHRLYNKPGVGRWIWNYDFKAQPGEFYFDDRERAFTVPRDGVLIEPNVPWHKSVALNKDWGISQYQLVADYLRCHAGVRVFQFSYGKLRLAGVELIPAFTFRQAAAALAGVSLAIVPEGGLHHAAAAVGTKAIVIFGAFIPPAVTGYDSHVNLTGDFEFCGSLKTCAHCRAALNRITVEQVYDHAAKFFEHRQSAAASERA